MSSRPFAWRATSLSMAPAITGSTSASDEFLFIDPLPAFFHLGNFLNARGMPATFKLGRKPCAHYFRDVVRRRSTGAYCQHVGVVMLARETRSLFRPRNGSANAWNLVGGDRHSGARPANQQSLLDLLLR